MSSISRWRNGLMALSVIGAPVLGEVLGPSISRQDAPLPLLPELSSLATSYRESGLVVCPACSIAWGWKSLIQPDGGEGLAKHKGVIARWRLKAVWSKTAT